MVRETSAGNGLVLDFCNWVGSETAESEHLGGGEWVLRSGFGLKNWVLEMGFEGGSGRRDKWGVRDWVWRSIGVDSIERKKMMVEKCIGGQ